MYFYYAAHLPPKNKNNYFSYVYTIGSKQAIICEVKLRVGHLPIDHRYTCKNYELRNRTGSSVGRVTDVLSGGRGFEPLPALLPTLLFWIEYTWILGIIQRVFRRLALLYSEYLSHYPYSKHISVTVRHISDVRHTSAIVRASHVASLGA